MRPGWWLSMVLVAAGLLTAGAPSPAPPPATNVIGAAAHASVVPPASNALPGEDDDGRDNDSDNDDDSDDASLTTAVAVPLPDASRLGYRSAASTAYTPPDAEELLRPPQRAVG